MNKHLRIKKSWWKPNSFFPFVYRLGDDSEEGFLEDKTIDIQARTKRECDFVESILNLKTGMRILDCPCGYGRHAIELALRGYLVTGVDLCSDYIDEAIKTSTEVNTGKNCEFFLGDMRNLRISSKFDIVVNMFLSFGFFDEIDNVKVLQEFYRVLKPGGQLLIHTDVNPDRVAQGCYGDRLERSLRSGGKLIIYEKYNEKLKRLEGEWTVQLPNSKVISSNYTVRIYSHKEISDIMQQIGFRVIEIKYPGAENNLDLPPQEVVYVARK